MIVMSMALFLAGAEAAAITQAQATDLDKSEYVCTTRKKANSRFLKKRCLTREEYDKMAEENRRNASDMLNRPSINRGDTGG